MNDRKSNIVYRILSGGLFLAIGLIIFFALNKRSELNPNTALPIFGNHSLKEYKNEKGKTLTDTVFHTVPAFSMINQEGDTVTDTQLEGVISVVDFFFTTCPDICIDMARNKRKLQNEFLKYSTNFQILSFTVNPKKDTQEQLLEYAYDQDVNFDIWNLLTGEKKEIYELARKGFLVTALEGDGGPNDFIHSNKFVLIDKEKRIRGFYNGTSNEEIERLISDIKKLDKSYKNS